MSWTAMSLLLLGWTFALVTLVLAATKQITWLDFLYYCSYIKLAVTLIKYVPQVQSHFSCTCPHTSNRLHTLMFASRWIKDEAGEVCFNHLQIYY